MENETTAPTAEAQAASPAPGDEGKVVDSIPETAKPAVTGKQEVFEQTWTRDRLEKLRLVDVVGNGAGASTLVFDSEALEPVPDIISPLSIVISDMNPPLALININIALSIDEKGKIVKKPAQVLVPIYRLLMTTNPQAVKFNLKFKRMPDMGMSAHVQMMDNLPKVPQELYMLFNDRIAKQQAAAAATGNNITPQDVAPAPKNPEPVGAAMNVPPSVPDAAEMGHNAGGDAFPSAEAPAEPPAAPPAEPTP